jgi:phytoene dehydrogenase-like protein
MGKFDIAVVGSGIGGSLITALNKNKNHILFESDSNLGGCASTFKRYGNLYNSGATTFVGYEENHPLKNIFDTIGIRPNITQSKVALRIVQNNKIIDRTTDFEDFLEQMNKHYPNKNNRVFWEKIKLIDEKFWTLQNIYYGKFGFTQYKKTLFFVGELVKTFGFDIIKDANAFIQQTLGNISKEYKHFIDAATLITIQSKANGISLLSLALGLAYPFHKVFYANGGMGKIIEDIVRDLEVHKNEMIQNIIKEKYFWILESNKATYKADKIILNTSIYQSSKIFEDKKIQNYFNKFSFSDQSAFVVYLTLNTKIDFLQHYQFIEENFIPNCTSNSFFVSISKKDDEVLSKNGYSITISTHSKALFWKSLDKENYEIAKEKTQNYIINKFLEYFCIVKKEQITKVFSGTSLTFNRYINRYNCGGKAINIKDIGQLPSNNTPFKALYNVGDTVFAGQGWPGVAIGVQVLQRQLNEIS